MVEQNILLAATGWSLQFYAEDDFGYPRVLGDDPKVFYEQNRPEHTWFLGKYILYTTGTLYYREYEKSPLTWKSSLNPTSISWVRGSKWPRNSDPKPSVGHMSLAEIIHHECWCGCAVRELVCEGIFLFFRKIAKGMFSSPMFVDLILERFHVLSRATAYEVMVADAKSWWEYVPKQWQTHISIQCIMFRLFRYIFCAILYISYLSHWNESFNAHVLFISSYAVSNSKIHWQHASASRRGLAHESSKTKVCTDTPSFFSKTLIL